ncbi:MAG: hypothetical protein U0235_07220 [Polyangiaceae bacterium]
MTVDVAPTSAARTEVAGSATGTPSTGVSKTRSATSLPQNAGPSGVTTAATRRHSAADEKAASVVTHEARGARVRPVNRDCAQSTGPGDGASKQ